MNTLGKAFGWLVIAIVLGLGTTMVVFPAAITQVAGLAVAQTSTQWNQLKDMAVGDAQSNGSALVSLCLFNGVTCDRQRGTITGGADVAIKSVSGGVTPSDAFANPTNALTIFGLNGLFNGTTWDRNRTANADNLAVTGIPASGNVLFDGTTFDRERAATGDALLTGIPAAGNYGFNSSTWDRLTGISATNNTAVTSVGVRYSTQLSTWSQTNTTSIAATAATTTKAAGGGTVRHVATSISACFHDSAINTVARIVNLRDGASGAGTILRTWLLSSPVAGEAQCINISGLNMTGSANTAMTLEFSAAPAATASETVAFTGYSTP